jgi:hypothetical protein
MASLCLHADRQHENSISGLQLLSKFAIFFYPVSILGAPRAPSDVNVISRIIDNIVTKIQA